MPKLATAVPGSLAFFVLPLVLAALDLSLNMSDDVGELAGKPMPLAQSLDRAFNSTEILAMFLLMLAGSITIAVAFYMLPCGVGVTLFLILLELRGADFRRSGEAW